MILSSWFPGTQHLRFAGVLSGLAQSLIRYMSTLYNAHATPSASPWMPLSDEQLTTPPGMSDGIGCKETPPLETHPSLYLLFIGANTSLWEENK